MSARIPGSSRVTSSSWALLAALSLSSRNRQRMTPCWRRARRTRAGRWPPAAALESERGDRDPFVAQLDLELHSADLRRTHGDLPRGGLRRRRAGPASAPRFAGAGLARREPRGTAQGRCAGLRARGAGRRTRDARAGVRPPGRDVAARRIRGPDALHSDAELDGEPGLPAVPLHARLDRARNRSLAPGRRSVLPRQLGGRPKSRPTHTEARPGGQRASKRAHEGPARRSRRKHIAAWNTTPWTASHIPMSSIAMWTLSWASVRSLPPSKPVTPIVFIPIEWAYSTARSTFAEFP